MKQRELNWSKAALIEALVAQNGVLDLKTAIFGALKMFLGVLNSKNRAFQNSNDVL